MTRGPIPGDRWIPALLLLLLLGGADRPAASQGIFEREPTVSDGSLTVIRPSFEFPGPLRRGRITSLPLVVRSGARGFEGELILKSFHVKEPIRSHRLAFELAPETSKVLWPCFRPEGSELLLEIRHRTGKLAHREVFTEPLSQHAVHILAVGDADRVRAASANADVDEERSSSTWDRSSASSTKKPVVASLSADTFPDRRVALDFVDVVVVAGVDLEEIPRDRVAILEEFVQAGGHLVVSLPEFSANQPLSSKWDALPVRIVGSATLEDLRELEALARTPRRNKLVHIQPGVGFPREPFPAARLEVTGDGQVLARTETEPLVVQRAFGLGRVTFLNFDIGRPPFRGANAGTLFMEWLLVPVSPFRFDRGLLDPSILVSLLELTPRQLIPIGALILFLGAYLVLIGPVNYFVLARRKKKELAAITIPVLAVIFFGIAYLFGFAVHGTKPRLAKQEIVMLPRDGGPARVESFIALYSPGVSTYDLAGEAPGSAVDVFHPQYAATEDSLEAQVWTTDDSVELRRIQTATWSHRFLRCRSLVESEGIDIRLAPGEGENRYDITIDNGLGVLSEVRIWLPEGTYFSLQQVPPGRVERKNRRLRLATNAYPGRIPGAMIDSGSAVGTSRAVRPDASERQDGEIVFHRIAPGIDWIPGPDAGFALTAILDEEVDGLRLDGKRAPCPTRTLILKEFPGEALR